MSGSPIKPKLLTGSCLHVTKQSSTEWRIVVPVLGAPDQSIVAEWRVVPLITQPISAFGQAWEISDLFGRDQRTPGADVQLSSATPSVYEYVAMVGVQDAPQANFDFSGNGHGGELLSAPITFVLDGIDISSFAAGSTADGLSLVITQAKDWICPKTADGTDNLVPGFAGPFMGTATTRHTFTPTGLLVEHTHVMVAGYQAYTFYAAMLPNHVVNLNRVKVNDTTTYTPVGDGSVQFTGTQITRVDLWHTTAHRYLLKMTLPSGGPAVPSDWSHAGPDYGFFIDNALRGKTYVLYVNDTYASRMATGPTAHSALYTVNYQ